MTSLFDELDRAIRRDPARRGLISSEAERGPLFVGQLEAAVKHLAEHGRCAGIVTGFYIPHATPPAAETDGPPGSALLAAALQAVGIDAFFITDEPCAAATRAAAVAMDLDPASVVVAPLANQEAWRETFFTDGRGAALTHLISIERVGPSHTPESLAAQPRDGSVPHGRFDELVAAESRNRCHNMRGRPIDDWTAALHSLFEDLPRYRPAARTVGVGDGGNEIGMGSAAWEELAIRLSGEQAGRVPCRIATDWTILAGVSNWGAMALAAGVLAVKGRVDVAAPWTESQQLAALEHIVRTGPAVDGVIGRAEATVDGLPFLTYIQPWVTIRRSLGL